MPPAHRYTGAMFARPLPRLQKLTTTYSADEDRMIVRARAVQSEADGEVLVLHFTQRLLLLFMPHFLDWIAGDETAWLEEGEEMSAEAFHAAHLTQHLLQGAAQGATASMRPQQTPVEVPEAVAPLVITRIDLKKSLDSLQLTLCVGDEPRAALVLSRPAARQWLDILWTHWRRADWPLHLWPDWAMRESE